MMNDWTRNSKRCINKIFVCAFVVLFSLSFFSTNKSNAQELSCTALLQNFYKQLQQCRDRTNSIQVRGWEIIAKYKDPSKKSEARSTLLCKSRTHVSNCITPVAERYVDLGGRCSYVSGEAIKEIKNQRQVAARGC